MMEKTKNILQKKLKVIEPFKDIALFLALFLFFEFIWKVFVHQGDDESILLVMGKDLTRFTEGFNHWTARSVYWLVHDLWGYHDLNMKNNIIFFNDSLHINIVWGCTGIKQLVMFTFILICYFGPAKKKIWYLPLSLAILIIINILRLAIITVIIHKPFPEWFIPVNHWYNGHEWINNKETYRLFYRDWFNIFHRDVFTWLYYDGVIFILWLIWEEKINKPFQKILKQTKKQELSPTDEK